MNLKKNVFLNLKTKNNIVKKKKNLLVYIFELYKFIFIAFFFKDFVIIWLSSKNVSLFTGVLN